MTRRAPGPARSPAVVLAVLAAGIPGACATTYDTSATTASLTSTTTTTTAAASTGSTDDRLTAIAAEVGALSEKLVTNDGQSDALARIEAEWATVRPVIDADQPELIGEFDAAIAQVRRSVERRRPADADKAAKNLAALIAALQT